MMEAIKTQNSRQYRWTIPSEPVQIHRVWGELKLALLNEIDEKRHFGIELVTRELLTNAMMHGNAGIPSRRVELEVKLWSGYLLVEVGDEGAGFNWQINPPKPFREDATSGRGLSIVLLYAQAVRYNTSGNRVKAWFTNVKKEHQL
jgi:anti-sigma regulatory factor (Ser/Thr protein kinase)